MVSFVCRIFSTVSRPSSFYDLCIFVLREAFAASKDDGNSGSLENTGSGVDSAGWDSESCWVACSSGNGRSVALDMLIDVYAGGGSE